MLYGLLINCTDIEEVYGQSAAVRTAFIGTNSKEMYGLVLLFSCICFGTEIEKGVRLSLLSTFPDFEKKFAGGDKLYFSPFSVLYFAEE